MRTSNSTTIWRFKQTTHSFSKVFVSCDNLLETMPPRNKDPNRPKGTTNAYGFFMQERREHYRKQGKEVQFTEFSRECAALWKGPDKISDDEKKRFVEMATADKERYEQEMASYVPPEEDSDEDTGKEGGRRRRRKTKKKKNTPKRAMSAFLFFSADKRPKLREKNPSATVSELAKQLGAAWKIMTPEQKKKYEDQAKKDRKRYEEEMMLYRNGKFVRNDVHEEEDDDEEDED